MKNKTRKDKLKQKLKDLTKNYNNRQKKNIYLYIAHELGKEKYRQNEIMPILLEVIEEELDALQK